MYQVETKISSHELAWIAVVDEDLKVVYETYVLPAGKIIDYRSRYELDLPYLRVLKY